MLFPAWETFYIILGSAAGALTGLMFVVIALLADTGGSSEEGVHAFATPTLVHFTGVLLLSLLIVVPWASMAQLAVAVAVFGVAGTAYMLVVWRRAARQTNYKPVLEDWLFYTAVPIAAYGTIVAGAAVLRQRETAGLFVLGVGSVLLICIGIRNAWDNVIYIAVGRRAQREGETH
jgi:hypothetical protein